MQRMEQQYLAQMFTVGNAIIDFFVETDWQSVVRWLKIISFIFSALFATAIAWTLKKHRDIYLPIRALRPTDALKTVAPEIDTEVKKYEHDEWNNLKALWSSKSLAEKRLSLIDADALLDNVLRERGVAGETMQERLASPEAPQLSNLEEVFFAHKFRNELVHESGATFDLMDAQRSFTAYERALKELRVI